MAKYQLVGISLIALSSGLSHPWTVVSIKLKMNLNKPLDLVAEATATPNMHLWSQINSLAKVRMLCYGVPLISVLHLVIRAEANFWCALIFGERFPQRSSRLQLGCSQCFPLLVEKQTLDHLHSGISQQIKMANKNTPDGLLINEFHWEHLRGVQG